MIRSSKKTLEVDKKENLSRRFFEVRLSQYALGSVSKTSQLESINIMILQYKLPPASTSEEVLRAVDIISDANVPVAMQHHTNLKSISAKYQVRDLGVKSEFMSPNSSESIMSRNYAGMKSSSPNFYDLISKIAMKNRVVDRKAALEDGYSSIDARNRSTFVSSISGHAFFFLAECELYILERSSQLAQEGRADENADNFLSKELNNILSVFVAVYANKGYHSFMEVMDVFHDPAIIEYFRVNYNLDIMVNFEPILLEMAMNDALAYSKGVCLKRGLHQELLSTHGEESSEKYSKEVSKMIQENIMKRSPLHFAAMMGDLITCEKLIREGHDIDARDLEQLTPLHLAALSGHTKICEILLVEGADVNSRSVKDFTPLHWAAMENHGNVCKILFDKKADVNAKDDEGQTPLDWANVCEAKNAIKALQHRPPSLTVDLNQVRGIPGIMITAQRINKPPTAIPASSPKSSPTSSSKGRPSKS